MVKQNLIIAMAEKLHRQDPTKTDEYNWLTAQDIVNKTIEAILYKKEIAESYYERRAAYLLHRRGGRGNGRGGKN